LKVAAVGVGYVGLVAAACLADGGNHVVCIDNDKKKIDDLKNPV
jgi:UDPglucose 6-dehydrogenase